MKNIFTKLTIYTLALTSCFFMVMGVHADTTTSTASSISSNQSSAGAVDKIDGNFDKGIASTVYTASSGVTAKNSQASFTSGSTLQTVGKLDYFMVFFNITNAAGGDIEVTFGNSGASALGLVFKKDTNTISLENLTTSTGGTTATLTATSDSGDIRNIDLFDAGSSPVEFKLQVIGSTVTLYAMKTGEPYDYLSTPVAQLTIGANDPASYGSIFFKADSGASFLLDNVKAYSLMPSVAISTENYVAPPVTNTNTVTVIPFWNAQKIAIAELSGIALVILAVIAFLIIILIKFNKKKKKKAEVEE